MRIERDQMDQRGFALLIVLWIFMVLFVLGAEFASGMRQNAQATVNFADETQSYYLATAAANRTFYRALIARDEATLGLTAGEVADAILDWRDPDDETRLNGVESDYYLGLSQPYGAKNAPLDSLDELRLIKGVTEEMYFGGTEDFPIGMIDIFSVFNRRSALSVRSASPEVLEVLLGVDAEQLAQLVEQRETDMTGMIPQLQAFLPDPSMEDLLNDDAPSILAVQAQARLPDARIGAHVGAVIDLGESNEGIYILRWMDALPMDPSVGAGAASFAEAPA